MGVHSNQLGTAHNAGVGTTTLYTCPTGKRTIVKSIISENTNAATQRLIYQIKNGATTKVQWAEHPASASAAGETVYRDLWVVMVPGDVLSVIIAAASLDVIVSGTELDI